MLKRIKDFIYDINDIFVALIIVLIAAGIIIWRSTSIMAYSGQSTANQPSNAHTNTIDVDFSGVDLTPTPVGDHDEPDQSGEDQSGEDQQGEEQSGQGTQDGQDTQTEPSDDDVITATITIEKGVGSWSAVANRLVDAGLIKAEEKSAFIKKVNDLGLGTKLQIGTFKLSSDMSFEEMIKVLCRKK